MVGAPNDKAAEDQPTFLEVSRRGVYKTSKCPAISVSNLAVSASGRTENVIALVSAFRAQDEN